MVSLKQTLGERHWPGAARPESNYVAQPVDIGLVEATQEGGASVDVLDDCSVPFLHRQRLAAMQQVPHELRGEALTLAGCGPLPARRAVITKVDIEVAQPQPGPLCLDRWSCGIIDQATVEAEGDFVPIAQAFDMAKV